MWCYVGKATKIFFFVVAVLAAAGLVVGFGVLRHHGAHSKPNGGRGPTLPEPMPATATTSAPPLLSPPDPVSASFGPAHS